MSTRKTIPYLALIVAVALVLAGFGPALRPVQADTGFATGEILVKFQPGTPGQAVAAAHRQNGGETVEVLPGIEVHVVKVPAGRELDRVAAYARNFNVVFAEVNGVYSAIGTYTEAPDDTLFSQQWQYNNTGQTDGTAGADIHTLGAWRVTTGNPGVSIAILDTGIDQSHPDLAAKITRNQNFTGITVDDMYGHGTHVAGSAAAWTNNDTGVAGTCPDCSLYNVKVLGDTGSGYWTWIANGITWAADNGAKVISMSLGGSAGSRTVKDAVDYAWNKGVVLVAAAGNSGSKAPSYPAYYANVIAVAATDNTDTKASWSNYGSWVDVAAPGVNILSTATDHQSSFWNPPATYGTLSGTSMATPHVAGLAGLIWSTGLGTSAASVRSQIENTADHIPGTGKLWKYGRINACLAVGGTCP